MEATPGLRERKKQRTREAIVDAAFELFAERGFDGTTIADIADGAEIAPRTFFSYFPSKDDVVFHDFEERHAMVASWLRDRGPGTNAIDALRAGIESMVGEADPAELRRAKRLRKRLIRENESLAAHSEHLRGKFAELLKMLKAEPTGPLILPVRDVRVVFGLGRRNYDHFYESQIAQPHEFPVEDRGDAAVDL